MQISTKKNELSNKKHYLGIGAVGLLALVTLAAWIGAPSLTNMSPQDNYGASLEARTTANVPIEEKTAPIHNINNIESLEKGDMPHIVFIMVDDIGWNDIGYQSIDLGAFTPHLDSLAEEGIKFTRFYSQPLCTPARGAFLTSKYPIHTGLQHWQIEPAQPWGLPLGHTLLPEYLQQVGYETHLLGKWHVGHYNNASTPLFRGFDSFYGFYSGGENYLTMESEDSCHQTYDGKGVNCYTDFMRDTKIEEQGTKIYNTELIRNQAQNILRAHDPDIPLFMLLAFPNNHVPLMAPDYVMKQHRAALDKIANEDRKTFAAMLILLDRAIHKVITTLKDTGLYDNSIIIVQSDNGGNPAGGGSNYPLRGLKKYMWEGGVRVPAFIHSPLLDEKVVGTTYEKLFHVTDWAPTILEGMIGIEHKDIEGSDQWDGVNQWEAIKDSESEEIPRNELLINIDYMDSNGDYLGFERAALIQGDWKLLVHENNVGWYPPPEGANEEVTVSAGGSKIYLYNIIDDPYEETNLRNNETELVYDLFVSLKGYLNTMVPSGYREEDTDAYPVFDDNEHIISWVSADEDPKTTSERSKIDPDRHEYEEQLRGILTGDAPEMKFKTL